MLVLNKHLQANLTVGETLIVGTRKSTITPWPFLSVQDSSSGWRATRSSTKIGQGKTPVCSLFRRFVQQSSPTQLSHKMQHHQEGTPVFRCRTNHEQSRPQACAPQRRRTVTRQLVAPNRCRRSPFFFHSRTTPTSTKSSWASLQSCGSAGKYAYAHTSRSTLKLEHAWLARGVSYAYQYFEQRPRSERQSNDFLRLVDVFLVASTLHFPGKSWPREGGGRHIFGRETLSLVLR